MAQSILDVAEADAWYGAIGKGPERAAAPVEEAVLQLAMEFVTAREATCASNPLLWWAGVLVQSSLRTGADDYISRGRFNHNILPMDLDIRARLEALLHYSKVLVLDHTMKMWKTSNSQMMEVRGDMAAVNIKWINAEDDQRLEATVDNQSCSSTAWKDILKHFQSHCDAYLGKQQGTPVRQFRLLLENQQMIWLKCFVGKRQSKNCKLGLDFASRNYVKLLHY